MGDNKDYKRRDARRRGYSRSRSPTRRKLDSSSYRDRARDKSPVQRYERGRSRPHEAGDCSDRRRPVNPGPSRDRSHSSSRSSSSSMSSRSSSSQDVSRRRRREKSRVRSHSRSPRRKSRSRERSRRSEERRDKKKKEKRRKDKEKHKSEKREEERRSVLTGKKIKLKVHKDATDLERDANREDLLQFLNAAYE